MAFDPLLGGSIEPVDQGADSGRFDHVTSGKDVASFLDGRSADEGAAVGVLSDDAPRSQMRESLPDVYARCIEGVGQSCLAELQTWPQPFLTYGFQDALDDGVVVHGAWPFDPNDRRLAHPTSRTHSKILSQSQQVLEDHKLPDNSALCRYKCLHIRRYFVANLR